MVPKKLKLNPIGICPVTQSSHAVGNALVPVIGTGEQGALETVKELVGLAGATNVAEAPQLIVASPVASGHCAKEIPVRKQKKNVRKR